MMNSKKGLSDIVTNVLIILLVLVAVSIIWLFLRPTIQQGAGSLGGAADCLTVQIEPVSCEYPGQGTDQYIQVRRKAGAGALNEVALIFTDSGGSTRVERVPATGLDELETTVFQVTGSFAGQTLSVAAVVSDGQGGTKTCSESAVTVTCT